MSGPALETQILSFITCQLTATIQLRVTLVHFFAVQMVLYILLSIFYFILSYLFICFLLLLIFYILYYATFYKQLCVWNLSNNAIWHVLTYPFGFLLFIFYILTLHKPLVSCRAPNIARANGTSYLPLYFLPSMLPHSRPSNSLACSSPQFLQRLTIGMSTTYPKALYLVNWICIDIYFCGCPSVLFYVRPSVLFYVSHNEYICGDICLIIYESW